MKETTSSFEGRWIPRPETFSLSEDEVHIWYLSAPTEPEWAKRLVAYLLEDEQDRAGRFHIERDRHRWVCARGILRVVLGLYLETPPGEFLFNYGRHGKPQLTSQAARDLRFNLSHSGDLIGIAAARGREVGIDIEKTVPDPDLLSLARRFFTEGEYIRLSHLDQDDLPSEFYRLWTCKEAVLKASGDGLSRVLNDTDVLFENGSAYAALTSETRSEEASRWSILSFNPDQDVMGALAVEGAGWQPIFIKPESLEELLPR